MYVLLWPLGERQGTLTLTSGKIVAGTDSLKPYAVPDLLSWLDD